MNQPEKLNPPSPCPTDNPDSPPTNIELSPGELIIFAMRLHKDGRLDGAEKCYRGLLNLEPDNANALHYLGVLLYQRDKNDQALEMIEKSIAIDPSVASWHNNLGNIFLDRGQFDEAALAYARCSELDDSNLEVLNNLGVLYRKMQRPLEAEAALKHVLQNDPTFVPAHNNLATLYTSLDRMPEAFSHLADALALRPGDENTRRLLIIAYGKAGRFDDGLRVCREWLELEPGDPSAQHFYAAYGGTDTPDRASDAYVVAEFDGFADSFDAKLASLEYKAPQWIGESVSQLLGEPRSQCAVLDAGCGTGLCAPFLRPFAKRLVGVDLSANMLSLAKERGVYDELVQSELVAFISGCEERFDLIASADTLCYFGRLSLAFMAVKRALKAGGHWVFTVEAHTGTDDFTLQPHGRYSHSRRYIESELEAAGFSQIDLQPVDLRFESKDRVRGWLVSAG